ncbi:MAG: hypothetical protein ABL921_08705 [Pirellula sp.]
MNRWLLPQIAFVGFTVLSIFSPMRAEAHSPFIRYHHHLGHGLLGHRHFGYFAPGYSFYYGYRPLVYRSYSIGFYSSPYYSSYYPSYYPAYCAPSYYSYSVPYFSWPAATFYQPVCANPWNGASSILVQNALTQNTLVSNHHVNTTPLVLRPDPDPQPVKLASAVVADDNVPALNAETQSQDQTPRLMVTKKPRLLQPYSPIWTKAAVGLVDNMIEAGQFEDACSSCRSMEKIAQSKGAGVYLRQGLTTYFSKAAHDSVTLERSLDFLNDACLAGSALLPSELESDSLSRYFAACSTVDVRIALDQLSKNVLEQPDSSAKDLILLAALLKLDGQSDRAKLFAEESYKLAARKHRWDGIVAVCMGAESVSPNVK